MEKISKAEHMRNRRRRMRQLIGLVLTVLIFIGITSVFWSIVGGINILLDDTDERLEYADKLAGLVMFDPLPFEGAENIQDTTVRSAAVWGTLYDILQTEDALTNYSRDPVTDQVLLPSVEVDAYLAKIFGPEFQLTHKTFEMEGMTLIYDETLLSYYIPVTSMVGRYTPVVEKLTKKDSKLYVTVGYISTYTDGSFVPTNTPQEPSKYMDYVFESTDGTWYLTGLVESDMVATAPATTPEPQATTAPLEDFETYVLEDLADDSSSSESADTQETTESEASEDEESADSSSSEASEDEESADSSSSETSEDEGSADSSSSETSEDEENADSSSSEAA